MSENRKDWYQEDLKMADRTKNVEDCLSTATNLRLTVNKVFQDLLNDPCANNQLPGDSSESGAYVTQNLKRNLVGVYKALRYQLNYKKVK